MSDENPALDAERLALFQAQAKAMSTDELYRQFDLAHEIIKKGTYKSHETVVYRRQILQTEVKFRENDYLGWAQGKYEWEGDF